MDFARRAILMPKTLRIEVDETDTQLYSLPSPSAPIRAPSY
jgi:hypothetical protein